MIWVLILFLSLINITILFLYFTLLIKINISIYRYISIAWHFLKMRNGEIFSFLSGKNNNRIIAKNNMS